MTERRVLFLLWGLWTTRLKHAADVAVLDPPTRLNQLLYGAEWWHVFLFGCVTILAAWELRLIVRAHHGKTQRRVD